MIYFRIYAMNNLININIDSMLHEMKLELSALLNYWAENSIDDKYGGFLGEINGLGIVTDKAEKGAVLNARLLWTFSAAYAFSKDKRYLSLANRAYQYLVKYFWDQDNGGLYWSLNFDGTILNNRKQAYAQGFGIYAFSEYFKVTGNKESLAYAVDLYRIIEAHYKDHKHGGYFEALSNCWEPLVDMRLSEKDANEPKSMNTHLHIVEPYTNLYKVWSNSQLKVSIQYLLDLFSEHIINKQTFHFNLFFQEDWKCTSQIVSFGHDIEGAWLLNEAAYAINDTNNINRMMDLSMKMVDATIIEGIAPDGSIYYEKENGQLDTDRHWWPQAEALVGFTDAYLNTNNEVYLQHVNRVWKYIIGTMKDPIKGEWFWKVSDNGKADTFNPKLGFWKCPYHNSRALIEVIKRLGSN